MELVNLGLSYHMDQEEEYKVTLFTQIIKNPPP